MNEFWHSFLLVAVMSGVTVLLRALPFLVFHGGKPIPGWVTRLSVALPAAVMTMLVVYCFRKVTLTAMPFGLPEVIATATVVGIHLWKKNSLLSVLSGTVVYMLLVQLVF